MEKYKIDQFHEELSNSDVRKTLSKMAHQAFYYMKPDVIRKQIEQLQKDLEESEKAHAAVKMISFMGWKEHDFSDHTAPAPDGKYYNFVGTEEEANEVRKKLNIQ